MEQVILQVQYWVLKTGQKMEISSLQINILTVVPTHILQSFMCWEVIIPLLRLFKVIVDQRVSILSQQRAYTYMVRIKIIHNLN